MAFVLVRKPFLLYNSLCRDLQEVRRELKMSRNRKKKMKLRQAHFLLAGAFAVLLASALLLIDDRSVRFYLEGEQNMTAEYGSLYTEPGISAVSVGRVFGEDKTPLEVVSSGEVDTSVLGSYTVDYTARILFTEYHTFRTVTVTDTVPPVIELRHSEGYAPSWFDGYNEEGYTAFDACDGDITDKVERAVLPDRIVYSVRDSSGNEASVERVFEKTGAAPSIILEGGHEIEIDAKPYYELPGFAAFDADGNDVSGLVEVEGEFVPYRAGEYAISYSLTNEKGESIVAERRIRVLPVPIPETEKPESKTIYLTFDDGPGPYTETLLNVLKAYGAKASFFVTGQNSRYLSLIDRELKEGHAVGVHTMCHDYNTIYSSEYAFFEDFFAMEDAVYQQTGLHTRLFRFPGGSSNTVSSFNEGIMTRLSEAMTDMGYKYFDWNVLSGDTDGTTKTDKIAENIINGCKGNSCSIVLQHDIKNYSVAAVEKVLKWGQANGYTFAALSMSSPSAQHRINN